MSRRVANGIVLLSENIKEVWDDDKWFEHGKSEDGLENEHGKDDNHV